MVMYQVPKPNETVSDESQQLISIRRNFIRMLEMLISKDVEFLNEEVLNDLILYICNMAVNTIEGSVSSI